MKRKNFTMLIALVLMFGALRANNIVVSNVTLTGQNTSSDYIFVQFDISWENSWRTSSAPNNWDAAWVFVKYRVGSGEWQHAWLNDTGHSSGTGTGATIDVGLQTPGSPFHATTNPGMGVFIYRSANGTGTFSITGAQLRWNYGANGLSDDATVDIKMFAIEMVYVPQGAFIVGSGGTESGSFTNGSWTSGATISLTISTENDLTIANTAGNLWGTSTSGLNTIGGSGTLSASFPKGFAGFYCMKYEMSQQQYVDFLNTLTRTQQDSRTATNLAPGITSVTNRYVMSNTSSVNYRNGIRCDGTIHGTNPITFYCDLNGNGVGGEANDGQWIACNYLTWMDGAAYLDWAGLRPMTELEYEKACRGTLAPVANEYAWGSTSATAANNITNPGASNETTNTSGANVVFNFQSNVQGPMRVGVFAKSGTTREESGASYYGIMELSGNLWERVVTVGDATGRAFTGVHGDGALSANGHANQAAWPGLTGGEVTDAFGSGFRGGSWTNVATLLRASDRSMAARTYTPRDSSTGFRGVRRVP